MALSEEPVEGTARALDLIRERAFVIYEERLALGQDGDELGDWLRAEAEILRDADVAQD